MMGFWVWQCHQLNHMQTINCKYDQKSTTRRLGMPLHGQACMYCRYTQIDGQPKNIMPPAHLLEDADITNKRPK